jgi:hypothetical protein
MTRIPLLSAMFSKVRKFLEAIDQASDADPLEGQGRRIAALEERMSRLEASSAETKGCTDQLIAGS